MKKPFLLLLLYSFSNENITATEYERIHKDPKEQSTINYSLKDSDIENKKHQRIKEFNMLFKIGLFVISLFILQYIKEKYNEIKKLFASCNLIRKNKYS